MAGNRTLTIVKPDAFGAGKAGKIIALLEEKGFRVVAARVMHLTQQQAGAFYEIHRERPFYGELVTFMTSGPCMPMILEKADAVQALRDAIGATDPAEAASLMNNRNVDRVPVVKEGRLVGFLTRGDIVRKLIGF